MLAQIEKRINEENARPKKRYISPATREEVYAIYYDQLRRKIEDRGTRNFPENQGKKLYGELTMLITIDADGRVLDTEVVRGSGSKVLDRRAVAIVHAAAPYGRFNAAMRKQADQLAIPSRFRFTREEGLETTLSGSSEHRVGPATASRYAVVGNPVAHSQSPFIHAAFAGQTGEPITYDRLLCPLDGFAAAAREFAAGGASGCNVTMPFKFEAFTLAARRTARAEVAGACNVLRFDADGWFGDNTDGAGLVRDIERNAGVALRGARVLLIGAGGGAAGALGALVAAGAGEVVVANRTVERAHELVARHRAALADGAARRASRRRRSSRAARRSTSSSTPAPAARAAPRCRSRRPCCAAARSPST